MDVELSKFSLPKFCPKKIFSIASFTNLTWFVMLRWNMEFRPILDKKDPPEDKELVSSSYLINPGHYQRLYHHCQLPLNYSAKVTK